MAQEQEDAESPSQTLDHSHSSSSSADPSLSRNASFSKLNAQAPEFVPTRPQQPPPPPPPPRLTVVPPPSTPALMHIYPPPPHSPFHVPIHSPVPVPHVIPVQNHHPHHNHHHHQHHHNHHQHHHHNQQYVPVRNHNNHHQGQNSHYVPVQYQLQNHYGPGSKKGQSEEELEAPPKKDVASSDHASKSDKNGLSDEAMQKLLNQVEYYFSDLNLATTDHLMRFINKDPEGYVPISVVASFKKIKVAILSNSQLASILRNSSKLVVSEDGKKVRRQHPLTESDLEELQTRIVIAENLPEDHCHQNLMKIFSSVGSVKTIRTCPPQNSGGGNSSASRSAKVDGMHFSNKLHAFVEYESIEIAEKAIAELNDEENWGGLKVRLMLKRSSKPTQGRGKKGPDGQGHSEEEEVSTSEQQPNEKQNEDSSQQYDNHSHEHSGEDHTNDKEGPQRKGRNRGRGKGRGRGQYHHNNRGNHVNPLNNQIIGEQPSITKQPPGPRMPDGTRGFAMGRGKPVAVNIT